MSKTVISGTAKGRLSLFAGLIMALTVTSCERPGGSPAAGDPAAKNSASEMAEKTGPLLADEPDTVPPPPPDLEAVKEIATPVVNKDAEVSILGYHDFSDGDRRLSEMVMHVDDFRAQMQLIKDAELPVISMQEYLAWRRGEGAIPERCVMITIDDGWKATHTLALPVLREFDYPFTVFLYKKYVGIGGRSLSHEEVREIMAGGGTVGSHSVSHESMISKKGRSEEEYDEWLRVELEDSYEFLVDNFGKDGEVLKVFAYPFGIYSDQVVEKAIEYGYEAAFTVNGKKTHWDTEPLEAGRYIVYGKGDQNFAAAMAFRGGELLTAGKKLMEASDGDGDSEGPRGPLVVPYPKDGDEITERRPVISLDVSKLEGVDPSSIRMRVAGFGEVQHYYDDGTGIIRYQVPMSLRSTQCGVSVRLRHAGNENIEEIAWNFSLNRIGSYLDGIDPSLLSDQEPVVAPAPEPAPAVPPSSENPATAQR